MKIREFIENHEWDIFFCCGYFLTMSMIFAMRFFSVCIGTYLPFSGNFGMRYETAGIWRPVIFTVMSVLTAALFISRKKDGKPGQMLGIILPFIQGAATCMGLEIVMHFIAFRLGGAVTIL